jgi:hypothetical protein
VIGRCWIQQRLQRTKSGALISFWNPPQIWGREFLQLRDVCTVTVSGFGNSRKDLEWLHADIGERSRQIRLENDDCRLVGLLGSGRL